MAMKITYNGRDFESWDELPPEAKQQLVAVLPDRDRNGAPDLLEGAAARGEVQVERSFVVDGKSYASEADLPPSVHEALRQARLAPAAPVTRTFSIGGGAIAIAVLIVLLLGVLALWLGGVKPPV